MTFVIRSAILEAMKIPAQGPARTRLPGPRTACTASPTPPAARDGLEVSDPRPALIERLLHKDLPPALAGETRTALLAFGAQALENLLAAGVRFQGGQPHAEKGGDYNPWTRRITLVQPGDENGWKHFRSYVLHEAVHALDHQQGKAKLGRLKGAVTPAWDEFASRRDDRLSRLHREATQRSTVDLAWKLKDQMGEASQTGPLRLPCRTYQVGHKSHAPQVVVMEDVEPLESLLASAGPSLTPALLGTSVGLLLSCVGLPLIGGPLLAVGLANALTVGRWMSEERRLGTFDNPELGVSSQRTRTEVDLSKPRPAPSMISPYATLARKSHEYFAEGMADFLSGGELRQALAERDPQLYDYCLEKGWHADA